MALDVRSVGGHLASLAWVALRSFLGTLFVLTLAGVLLAGLSYFFLRDYPWFYGFIAVVVALVESVTVGFVLGAKRALAMALAHGLGALHLGRSLVRLVFERMLGVHEGKEPGGRLARGLERLPLAQAEQLLSDGVRGVTGEAASGGWLRRTIQARLLESVRKYTLARFREEGSQHSGVDLLKVREELEGTVDAALIRKLCGGLRLWTVLVVVGLPSVVALQTLVLILYLRSHG